jgi:para-nitrobenzyl esterase
MSNYWVNFITRGNPNGKGLPEWPAYSLAAEPYLEFGASLRTGSNLLKRELDFLERALARRP